jgi:pyruvate dehydrogenase E2 component (dihydrolipoamide acetyltransferase)
VTQAVVVVMPRLSDSMEQGTILKWLKGEGEDVAPGDELVEIETDKATMTYEAEAAGALRRIVGEGDTVGLGAPIAELVPEATASHPPSATAGGRTADPSDAVAAERNGRGPAGRVPASPVARRLAEARGVVLARLTGTGPRGRIVKRDVEAAAASAAAPDPKSATPPSTGVASSASAPAIASGAKGAVSTSELSRVQATVARRMAESRATIPDFSLEMEVDADALVEMRAMLSERLPDAPPSYNDFVVKASALALRAHPRANGAFRDGQVELYGRANVGVAVAAGEGLLVPVINDADQKTVGTIAAESRRVAERARSGSLSPAELGGGTFSVSNLGMYGVRRFVAVVNPPQAAILAVGALEQRPVVREGELRVGHVMSLTLCADHRILYGADAAAFLADIRAALEEPLRLLV